MSGGLLYTVSSIRHIIALKTLWGEPDHKNTILLLPSCGPPISMLGNVQANFYVRAHVPLLSFSTVHDEAST